MTLDNYMAVVLLVFPDNITVFVHLYEKVIVISLIIFFGSSVAYELYLHYYKMTSIILPPYQNLSLFKIKLYKKT